MDPNYLPANGTGIGSPGETFFGLVDEAAVYSRALSYNEIAGIYAAGSAGKCKPVPPCVPAPSGLVHWWAGDGNTSDNATGNAGVLRNGASFAAGKVGQTFSLDGVTNYVEIPDSPTLFYPRTNSFSVGAWIKTTNASTGQFIVDRNEGAGFSSGGAQSDYTLYMPDTIPGATAGHLAGYMRDTDAGGPGGNDSGGQFLTGPTLVADGNWHYVVMVRDQASSQMILYLDGRVEASAPLNAGSNGNIKDDDGLPDPITIGVELRDSGTLGHFFNGLIDDVQIYSRALSSNEIAAIYAAATAGLCKPQCVGVPAGLVLWWDFLDSSAEDVSGFQNHGTVHGTPVIANGTVRFDNPNGGQQASQWIELPYSPTISALETNSFTVAIRYKSDDNTQQNGRLFGNGYPVGISIDYNAGAVPCAYSAIGDSVQSTFVPPYVPSECSNSVQTTDGAFHWQTLCLNRTNGTVTQYVDVGHAGTASLTNLGKIDLHGLVLGAAMASDTYAARGTIVDELCVFNRALSSNEIAAIYAAGSAGMCKPQCVAPPSGLISWWPGDGAGNDLVGTNHAEMHNGASFAPGRVGQAFNLDGVDDYVRIPDNATLKPQELTIELWFNSAVPLTASSVCIPLLYKLNETDGANGVSRGYDVFYAQGGLYFGLRDSSAGYRIYIAYTNDIPADTWHHVAGTYGSSGQRLYLDGQLVRSGPFFGTIGYSEAPILLGRVSHVNPDLFFFKGSIDEVSLYSRALTSNEIAAIYSAGSAGKCKTGVQCISPPSGLVGWWPAEGSGNDAASTHNLTLRGGAAFRAWESWSSI